MGISKPNKSSLESLIGALEGSPAAVWAQDTELRYLWIYNPFMDLKDSEIMGKSDHDLLEWNFADRITSLKKRAMNEEKEVRETVKMVMEDSHETHDLFIRPISDEDGTCLGIVCVAMRLPESEMTLADEANHRIKNSLMLAQSLLRMQRRGATENHARDALLQAEGQIQSIAKLHGKLADTHTQGVVNVKDYLETICTDLLDSVTQTTHCRLQQT